MYARKIVQSGLASHTVALPKEWVLASGLHKGDLVYIEKVKDGLLITTGPHRQDAQKTEEIVHDTTKKTQYEVTRDVVAAYLNNCHKITLKGANLSKYAKRLREVVNDLIGMEIIEEEGNRMVLRSFIRLEDANPTVLLRRIDHLVRSMLIDGRSIPEDPIMAEYIEERDRSVNKFCFLLQRVVKAAVSDVPTANELKLSPIDCLLYWEMSQHLEKIGDGIKRCARSITPIARQKGLGKRKDEMLEFLRDFQSLYEESIISYYQTDVQKSDSVLNRRRQLTGRIKEWQQRVGTTEATDFAARMRIMVHHVADIARLSRYSR
jgi:phosphate uptake regulator